MELVENPYLSDFTKKTLLQFDWKDGDPIPAVLGEKLLQIKETLPASARTDVLVDAEKMPAAAIEEVNKLLAEAKRVGDKKAKLAEAQKDAVQMVPQVRDALERILGPQIVDDRDEVKEEVPPPAAPAQEEKAPEPTASVRDTPLETEEPQDQPTEPMLILPFCPRCGWDMRQKFEVEVTDRDKEDFVACLLGNTRFKRRYELMGGKMILTLRALLSEENKMIYKQLVVDQRVERVRTEGEWYAQLIEYRLACSVESIKDGDGKPVAIVPEMHEMPAFSEKKEYDDDTALVGMLDFINSKVLAQEVTKRLVSTHLRQFQRLIEALEAMALDPSFWNGIE